jgi:hypothetical protein
MGGMKADGACFESGKQIFGDLMSPHEFGYPFGMGCGLRRILCCGGLVAWFHSANFG